METLGHISFKKIYYCNVRTDNNWFDKLPETNWIAFTIANNEDMEFMAAVAGKCLNSNVSCICSAGQLASESEDFFRKQVALRNIPKEKVLLKPNQKDNTPLLTFHTNFSEGFWFAASIADPSTGDPELDIDKVVCIDLTKDSVKRHLRDLIGKFNSGELPSDKEFEEPVYDSEIN